MSEFTEQELERVIRKIKHCLALSSSANEHEAAAALRQAQAMMRKYRLTETDVQLSDVGKSESEIVQAKRPAWDGLLASVVAQAFHCKALEKSFWCKTALKKRVQAAFVGVSPAQDIALYAYEALRLQVSTARQDYINRIKAGKLPHGRFTPETRGNHFAMAWVSVISEKLEALVPSVDQEQELGESDTKALVQAESKENELIDAFMLQLNDGKGAGQKRAHPRKKANAIDLFMGSEAGRAAELHQGLATGADQLALSAEDVL